MVRSAFYILLVVSAIKATPNSYFNSVVSDLGKWIPFPSNSENESVEVTNEKVPNVLHRVLNASTSNKDVEVVKNRDESVPVHDLQHHLGDEKIQPSVYDTSIEKMKVLAKGIRHVVNDLGLAGSSQRMRSVGASEKSGFMSTLKNLFCSCSCGLFCENKDEDEETRVPPRDVRGYPPDYYTPTFENTQFRPQLQDENEDLKGQKYEAVNVAAFAIKGRRNYMEDRFVVMENIGDNGVSLFAVFDGHGGDFAAEYVANRLTSALRGDVYFFKNIIKDNTPTDELSEKMASYLNQDRSINYEKLLNDEILATDESIKSARNVPDTAGTTALVAVIENDQLIVANVGDTRGVMCDGEGNAIRLSFDHKPNEPSEKERIEKAGGKVIFDTRDKVWRVGVLSTSRALGDYDSKNNDSKVVIANPHVQTFDLSRYHRPQFLILASDGLWDAFEDEEAVAFVKEGERFKNPLSAAESIALEAYKKKSWDNITVIIVNLS